MMSHYRYYQAPNEMSQGMMEHQGQRLETMGFKHQISKLPTWFKQRKEKTTYSLFIVHSFTSSFRIMALFNVNIHC
jgi:hypothetical protein